jgi:glycosyltransferase involved in cell wall biosynthesis
MKYQILHVVPQFFPAIGGLENMVFDLAKEQAKKHRVSILTLNSNIKLEEIETKDEIKINRFPASKLGKISYLFPKKGFCESFAKQDFDVVFTHTRFFITSFLAGRVAKKMGKKWIHVEHGANYFQAKNVFIRIMARIFDETFGKWVLKNADKVVVLTESGKIFVSKFGQRENVFIILNGVKISSEIKRLPHQNRAIFVGRATAEKGIYELLHTAKKCPQWQFQIIGANPLALRNTKNVQFLGELSREEVRQKIMESSLLISPSWGEGFGLSFLEAASLGRPILSTNVGIANEIITSEFIIPVKNSDFLAKKIQELTNDFAKLEEVGKKNWQHAQKFSLEKMIKRYEDLL